MKHVNGAVIAFFVLCVGLAAWASCEACRSAARHAGEFDGTWQLLSGGGVTAAWLRVSGESAERGHAPGIACRIVRSKGELRMSWADGFRDVLKITDSGAELWAMPRWSDDWAAEPRFKLTAVRKM